MFLISPFQDYSSFLIEVHYDPRRLSFVLEIQFLLWIVTIPQDTLHRSAIDKTVCALGTFS